VAFNRIDAYAKDLNVELCEIRKTIFDVERLFGASRRVILRIKIEQNPFALVIRKRAGNSVLVGQDEGRSGRIEGRQRYDFNSVLFYPTTCAECGVFYDNFIFILTQG